MSEWNHIPIAWLCDPSPKAQGQEADEYKSLGMFTKEQIMFQKPFRIVILTIALCECKGLSNQAFQMQK